MKSDAERDARRAERREARRERRRVTFGFGAGFDPGAFAEGIVRDFVGGGADLGGEEFSEPVSGRFIVSGMPYIRVRNVSGRTSIRVGADGEVAVSGRKYVRASNADRAKRLLDSAEVRMEQDGNEIRIGPHLYDEERSWADLFRSGRVAVDLEITVPRETQLDARTVSGELTISGTRGPAEVKSVSGGVTIEDLQGPMRMKTVSGDASVRGFAGVIDANSVSGEVSFQGSRLRSASVVTVSGDIELDGDLEGDDDHRIKTISGDVDLAVAGASYTIEFRSMSGDVDTDLAADVSRDGRRDKTVRIGSGARRVRVKTVSGDLHIRRSTSSVPEPVADDAFRPSALSDEEQPAGTEGSGPSARDILDRLARGELTVDEAAAALDDGQRPADAPGNERLISDGAIPAGLRGRVLRIVVMSGKSTKVNLAIPLSLARLGKTKIAASGLVRSHLGKFGIDLDEVLRSVNHAGNIVDISDNEDRILISVE